MPKTDLSTEGHSRSQPSHTQKSQQNVHEPNWIGIQHLQHTQKDRKKNRESQRQRLRLNYMTNVLCLMNKPYSVVFTISEFDPLCNFMAFSCTFPIAASAQSARETRITPLKKNHTSQTCIKYCCMMIIIMITLSKQLIQFIYLIAHVLNVTVKKYF